MSQRPPFPVQLNPRHGWLGWWPGFAALLNPDKQRIIVFIKEEAARLPNGAPVLDAGAGQRSFAPLFARQRYESCDMPGGFYKQRHDFECPCDQIPRPDDSYAAVVNTQVLEHVPDPLAVLNEFRRVLMPGGVILLSLPLNAPLHGEPWHFFHFTHYGVWELAQRAGLELVSVEKLGGTFWSLGKQVPDAFRKWMKQYDPGRAKKRGQNPWFCILMNLLLIVPWLICYPLTAFIMRPLFYWLDRTDREKTNASGYTIVLRKPTRA
jgi:SAM-dependent methyltransferase